MDKLIVGSNGQATISNDGATILKLLDVVHPAAKTLVDIARAQDAEVGDGTTSVVLLAAEFMREAKPFIEDGVSPHVIIKAYRKAAELVSLLFPFLPASNEAKMRRSRRFRFFRLRSDEATERRHVLTHPPPSQAIARVKELAVTVQATDEECAFFSSLLVLLPFVLT